ncbi:hypothetical protein Tco_1518010 [Tanacetum coccineum]
MPIMSLLEPRTSNFTDSFAAEAARAGGLEGLKEGNAALEGQVMALESTTVTKDTELASYNTYIAKLTQDLSSLHLSCDELSIKASSFEFEKEKLVDQVSKLEGTCFVLRDEVSGYKLFKEQVEAVHDEQVKALSDHIAGLDFDLMEMALHTDEEFYPIMKCLKSLGYLAAMGGAIGRAIDKANYVSAINTLCTMDFPLLAQLESHKDASMSDIMDLFRLEGPAAEIPEASQLHPPPEQLMLLIHRLEDQVVIGEISLSFSLDVAHARVQRIRRDVTARRLSLSEAMVPLIEPLSAENLVGEASTLGVPVSVATTTALATTFVETNSVPPIPQTEAPPSYSIVFEKEELDTTPKHPTAS